MAAGCISYRIVIIPVGGINIMYYKEYIIMLEARIHMKYYYKEYIV